MPLLQCPLHFLLIFLRKLLEAVEHRDIIISIIVWLAKGILNVLDDLGSCAAPDKIVSTTSLINTSLDRMNLPVPPRP